MGNTRMRSIVFSVPAKRLGANESVTRLVHMLVGMLERSGVEFVGMAGFFASGRMTVVAITPNIEKFREFAKAKHLRFREGLVGIWEEQDAGLTFRMLEQYSASGTLRTFAAFRTFKLSANGTLSFKTGGFGFGEGPG